MSQKTCTKCHTTKNLEEFHRSKAHKWGFSPKCKTCAHAYYLRNREKMKSQAAEWRKNNPERYAHIQREWRKNNPEKIREYAARQRRKKNEGR